MKLWWCFLNLFIFLLFFWNFLFPVRLEPIGTVFFFLFSIFLGLSLPILTWKEAMTVFSNFLNFFCYLFEIFYSGMGRRKSEWFFFYFPSFSTFPNLFWLGKKLWWCFLIFWIFLLFFLKFSILGRVEKPIRTIFFFFFTFLASPNLFWLGKKQWWCFLIFLFFCYFFEIFYSESSRNA